MTKRASGDKGARTASQKCCRNRQARRGAIIAPESCLSLKLPPESCLSLKLHRPLRPIPMLRFSMLRPFEYDFLWDSHYVEGVRPS